MKEQIIEQVNKIRNLMGLQEVMQSKIDEWEIHLTRMGNQLVTLIGIDDENEQRLLLYVGFNQEREGIEDFSYMFIIVDSNGNKVTDFLQTRAQVAPWIPNSIKSTRQIFPIILELTNKILELHQPPVIHRVTTERLEINQLGRYDAITNIFTHFGYDVTFKERDDWGFTRWVMKKNIIIEHPSDEFISFDAKETNNRILEYMNSIFDESIQALRDAGIWDKFSKKENK